MSLTGEKGIHKFLYVLNNCFLFCSAEQVIKRTFVRANLDRTCAYVLWSCQNMQTSLPFRRKWKTARRGAAEAQMRPRSWRPTPSATSTAAHGGPCGARGLLCHVGGPGVGGGVVSPHPRPQSPRHTALRPLPAPCSRARGQSACCLQPLFRSGGLRGQGDLAPGGCTTVWVPQSCWGPASDGRMRSSVRAPHTQAGTEPSTWLPESLSAGA